MVERFGSKNVCVGGHSLGVGFALQVRKALAKQGIFVECHIFNPPSVSLAMSIKSVGEKAGFLWKMIKESLSLLLMLAQTKTPLLFHYVHNSNVNNNKLRLHYVCKDTTMYVNNSN
ncbi:GDSL esterase/lipase [Canna indica]|uniref:GDSL esterase/lipase n=1 Tax=Canna indica TaxID=4628 RepID=A0AAQ3KNF4_9LILI|nr:GDSL esterase/lipase [Canna indica]